MVTLLDLLRFHIVFLYDVEHGINRSLSVAAAGVRFDRGMENLEILAPTPR